MTESRRTVITTVEFFEQLDRQLPAERGSEGRPSRNDFEAYDLLDIIEEFATGFDTLPELIPGRPQYRILIGSGRIVPTFSVVGQLAPGGVVELVTIRIDRDAPW